MIILVCVIARISVITVAHNVSVLFTEFEEQILWYPFDRQIHEHTLPGIGLGDEQQHSNDYFIEIISPVTSIEKSGAHVVIPDPILICIFNTESKTKLIITQ